MSVRVLHASPSFAPAYRLGGPIHSLEGLVSNLGQAGVSVKVLTTDSDGYERLPVPGHWMMRGGVPIRYVKRWFAPSGSPTYFGHALREAIRADIVHVTGVFSVCSMQALTAAKLTNTPVVLSPRGSMQAGALQFGSSRQKRLWLGLLRPLLLSTTVYHATSESEESAIHRLLGSTTRVAVIPNGTNIPPILPKVRNNKKPVIAFLGRIHPVKALTNLVEAASMLAQRGHAFELHLAGPLNDTDYRNELQAMACALSLTDRITFHGELNGEAKDRYLEDARVCVLPSHTENFGNVVIEALAHGVPVVASRGTPWADLERWQCGKWVENSPAELAEAIAPYIADEELAIQSGERGRLVAQRYSWAGVATRMAELYRQVLRGEHVKSD